VEEGHARDQRRHARRDHRRHLQRVGPPRLQGGPADRRHLGDEDVDIHARAARADAPRRAQDRRVLRRPRRTMMHARPFMIRIAVAGAWTLATIAACTPDVVPHQDNPASTASSTNSSSTGAGGASSSTGAGGTNGGGAGGTSNAGGAGGGSSGDCN